MKSKTLLSTAAFTIAFVFSAAFAILFIDQSAYSTDTVVVADYNQNHTNCFAHQGNYTADKIEVLLKQDERNARTRNRKLSLIDQDDHSLSADSPFAEYADTISEYAAESDSMDADGLPQEFQIAWREHMKAWRNYADFLSDMKTSSGRGKLSDEDLSKLDAAFDAEITRTWYEVLRVSDDYGADFR